MNEYERAVLIAREAPGEGHADLTDGDVVTYDAASDKFVLRAPSGGEGGGAMPAEWTVDSAGDLEIAPTDNTADYLVSVKGPAGFFTSSPDNTILQLVDESGNVIHKFVYEADYTMTAQAGYYQSRLVMNSVDHPGTGIQIQSGVESGSGDYIHATFQGATVFRVTDGGAFTVSPAVDDFAFVVESVDNATKQTFIITAATGQTGKLLEIDCLPDGNPCLTVGANGEISMPLLPTADPHVAGQLWNSSGVVHVSAG